MSELLDPDALNRARGGRTVMLHELRSRVRCGIVVLALLAAATPSPAIAGASEEAMHEQVIRVPLPPEARSPGLIATTYRPPGRGPFPLLVLSHGNPGNTEAREDMGRYRVLPRIREFVNRGFAVIVPMRRGYGLTGGVFAESFGSCASPDFYAAGEQAALDLDAAIAYARKLPWVDGQRVVAGRSVGGRFRVDRSGEPQHLGCGRCGQHVGRARWQSAHPAW